MDFVIKFPWQWIKIAFFAVFDSFLSFFSCALLLSWEKTYVCIQFHFHFTSRICAQNNRKKVNMQMPADASNKQWILICLDCMSFNAHYIGM